MKIDGREIIETSLDKDRFKLYLITRHAYGEPIAAFTILVNRSWKNKAHLVVTNKALILDIPEERHIRPFKFKDMVGPYESFEARFEDHKVVIKNWFADELQLVGCTSLATFHYDLSNMVNVEVFSFDQFIEVVAASLIGDTFMIGGDKNDR